jgi:hypothetical protein
MRRVIYIHTYIYIYIHTYIYIQAALVYKILQVFLNQLIFDVANLAFLPSEGPDFPGARSPGVPSARRAVWPMLDLNLGFDKKPSFLIMKTKVKMNGKYTENHDFWANSGWNPSLQ